MAVVAIVAPVFVLIALGYAAARLRWVGPNTLGGLNEFAFTLAMPALLFKTTADPGDQSASAFGVVAAYFGAIAATWLLATLITRFLLRRPREDAASIAVTSVYGNAVMLGIPLAFAAFGTAAAGPLSVILSLNTVVLWCAGLLHAALAGARSTAALRPALIGLVRDLVSNPLILAIFAGALWRSTGLGLAPVVERCLALIAQAGVPCALVALGMTLTGFAIKGQAATLATVLVLKLAIQPLIAWLLAAQLLQLPGPSVGVIVLLAAMPAGANAYLFAEREQRAVNSASGAVALGSLVSVATTTALIVLLGAA